MKEFKNKNIKKFYFLNFNILKLLSSIKKINKIIKKKKISTIYAIGLYPGLIASVVKIFCRVKIITTKRNEMNFFNRIKYFPVLLFMLFNAKRKQRAIPVIKSLDNTTVAFTQTIASLYLKENDHKNLVDKKIAYFLEKIRTKFLLDTNNLNKDFIEILAAKSGNEISNTKYLINTIITLNKRSECTKEELLVLHKMIDNFLKKQEYGN